MSEARFARPGMLLRLSSPALADMFDGTTVQLASRSVMLVLASGVDTTMALDTVPHVMLFAEKTGLGPLHIVSNDLVFEV